MLTDEKSTVTLLFENGRERRGEKKGDDMGKASNGRGREKKGDHIWSRAPPKNCRFRSGDGFVALRPATGVRRARARDVWSRACGAYTSTVHAP